MPGYEPGVPSEPRWLRLTGVCDRAYRLFAALREEVALACVGPRRWRSIVAERYGPQVGSYADRTYLQSGLFDWERSAVDAFFPRPPARVLVGGAGAGRETLALAELGYHVVALEPSPPLYEALARHVAALGGSVSIGKVDYEGLVAALDQGADGQAGPVRHELVSDRYEAIVLGFGSISYIADGAVRQKLLTSLTQLCPAGPVLISYASAQPVTGEIARMARIVRRLLRHLPSAHPVADGDYLGAFGFEHGYSDDEIQAMAGAAGYRVARLAREPYPHAVIIRERPSP